MLYFSACTFCYFWFDVSPALLVAGVQSKVLENSWLQTTADGGKQWPYFDTVAYHSDCCEINSIFCMSLLLLQTFQLCLMLQHSMHPDEIYYFFTSCIHLRPFNIPISLAMTCNKSDGVKEVWAESTVYYDIKHAWMKTKERKKIFPEWLRETFLFPSTHNILARGKEQGSDINSKTWTDSLNYVWEVSKNRDLVAYHSNLISPLDFYRPPFTSYSIAKSMASLQKGGLKCKYSCRKRIDFEDFRRAFLHFLNNPGLQKI